MNSDSDVMSLTSDSGAEAIVPTLSVDMTSDTSMRLLAYDSLVAGVVTSLLGWTTLYCLFHLYCPRHTSEWHCRWVAVFHAVTVVLLSAWSTIVQGPWPFTDPGGPNTAMHKLTCMTSMGYFIFDFAWCLYHQSEGPVMIFHHMLSIFGNGFVLYRGMNGTEMMATLFGSEITNPVLQLRWFLRYAGVSARRPTLAMVVDLFFLLFFTSMRICIGSLLLYCYLLHPAPDWIARMFSFVIYGLGWVFWYSIVRYAVRKYGHKLSIFHRFNKTSCSGNNIDAAHS